jgi:heat shock protein HtpX
VLQSTWNTPGLAQKAVECFQWQFFHRDWRTGKSATVRMGYLDDNEAHELVKEEENIRLRRFPWYLSERDKMIPYQIQELVRLGDQCQASINAGDVLTIVSPRGRFTLWPEDPGGIYCQWGDNAMQPKHDGEGERVELFELKKKIERHLGDVSGRPSEKNVSAPSCPMTGTEASDRKDVVYQRAKRKTPGLVNDIVLKVMYTPEPNAYAIGRRTICVSEGLFRLSDGEIKGILAHEVGHLACRHTEIQLLIGGGNFIVTLFILMIKVVAAIIAAFSMYTGYRNRSFITVVVGLFFAGIVWLWTKFCMLFLMWSMRKNEYVADAYAADLGYGVELARGLDAIGTSKPQESLLKALYSTHPNAYDRIGRLQQMGVAYTRY